MSTWALWDEADPEILERSEEFDAERYPPTFDDFRSIADAATESIIPVIRHIRHTAHTKYAVHHNPQKGHTDWNRHDGGAVTLTDDTGVPAPGVVSPNPRSNHVSRPRRRAARDQRVARDT